MRQLPLTASGMLMTALLARLVPSIFFVRSLPTGPTSSSTTGAVETSAASGTNEAALANDSNTKGAATEQSAASTRRRHHRRRDHHARRPSRTHPAAVEETNNTGVVHHGGSFSDGGEPADLLHVALSALAAIERMMGMPLASSSKGPRGTSAASSPVAAAEGRSASAPAPSESLTPAASPAAPPRDATVFHSSHVPNVSLPDYGLRLVRHAGYGSAVSLCVAIALMGRYAVASGRCITPLTAHRLLLACFYVGRKAACSNDDDADTRGDGRCLRADAVHTSLAGGVTVDELDRLEMALMEVFRFAVVPSEREVFEVPRSLAALADAHARPTPETLDAVFRAISVLPVSSSESHGGSTSGGLVAARRASGAASPDDLLILEGDEDENARRDGHIEPTPPDVPGSSPANLPPEQQQQHQLLDSGSNHRFVQLHEPALAPTAGSWADLLAAAAAAAGGNDQTAAASCSPVSSCLPHRGALVYPVIAFVTSPGLESQMQQQMQTNPSTTVDSRDAQRSC